MKKLFQISNEKFPVKNIIGTISTEELYKTFLTETMLDLKEATDYKYFVLADSKKEKIETTEIIAVDSEKNDMIIKVKNLYLPKEALLISDENLTFKDFVEEAKETEKNTINYNVEEIKRFKKIQSNVWLMSKKLSEQCILWKYDKMEEFIEIVNFEGNPETTERIYIVENYDSFVKKMINCVEKCKEEKYEDKRVAYCDIEVTIVDNGKEETAVIEEMLFYKEDGRWRTPPPSF